MDNKYIGYCGLYCENCVTKAKVEPAAKVLHDEMKQAGLFFNAFISAIMYSSAN